jgi:hypothetical protein
MKKELRHVQTGSIKKRKLGERERRKNESF